MPASASPKRSRRATASKSSPRAPTAPAPTYRVEVETLYKKKLIGEYSTRSSAEKAAASAHGWRMPWRFGLYLRIDLGFLRDSSVHLKTTVRKVTPSGKTSLESVRIAVWDDNSKRLSAFLHDIPDNVVWGDRVRFKLGMDPLPGFTRSYVDTATWSKRDTA